MAARLCSFSPHMAFRIANSTANPTPKIQVKYHIDIYPFFCAIPNLVGAYPAMDVNRLHGRFP